MKARIIMVDVFQKELTGAWDAWSDADLSNFRDNVGRIIGDSEGSVRLVTELGNEVFMPSRRLHSLTLEMQENSA